VGSEFADVPQDHRGEATYLAVRGRDMRMLSIREPGVARPNFTPLSYTRLNSTYLQWRNAYRTVTHFKTYYMTANTLDVACPYIYINFFFVLEQNDMVKKTNLSTGHHISYCDYFHR